jgi:hypothetical protein
MDETKRIIVVNPSESALIVAIRRARRMNAAHVAIVLRDDRDMLQVAPADWR